MTARPNPAVVYLSKFPSKSDSYKTMRSALDTVAKALGGDAARALTYPWGRMRDADVTAAPAKLTEYLERRRREKYRRDDPTPPGTVNKCLVALRGVLAAAWRSGWISPAEYQKFEIRNTKGQRLARGRAIGATEAQILREGLSHVSAHDAALIAVLRACGLRRVEAARLRRENYDSNTGELSALGKGNKERRVPVGPDWRPWIEAHWKTIGHGYRVFSARTMEDGRRRAITRKGISYVVAQFCEQVGIDPAFTPHDLRRSFATDLLNAGVDIKTVRDLMGHDSLDTTIIYDRRDEARKREAVKVIQ